MRNGKCVFVFTLSTVIAFFSTCVYSKNTIDVDNLLKTADLTKLVGNSHALYLTAQTKDSSIVTSFVNELDDFVVLTSSVEEDNSTVITEFDQYQNVLKTVSLPEPWLGVALYLPAEIPALPLQDALQLVQSCMADKGDPTPTEISRVTVYKTQRTAQMVYDYVFRDPNYPAGVCREVLYTPDTEDCERGMIVNCHDNLSVKEIFKDFHEKTNALNKNKRPSL